MVFSSLIFLYLFLPLTLAATFLAPARFRNAVLLAASLFFFAWGAPRFVFVLIAGCLLDWLLSIPLSHDGSLAAPEGRRKARWLLGIGVSANLLLLGYFKYANFAVDQINALLGLLGFSSIGWTKVALPIGISFFTFQKISYLVDVYRGVVAPAKSFPRYLLYVSLFPQLIAGPIVRYHDVAEQIDDRTTTSEDFLAGLWRFSVGLARKTLVANPLAVVADRVFQASAAGDPLSAGAAWFGLFAYTLQIYFDFAGYSDMAIGLGRIFGFRFLENFNAPYLARDMADFWRRWHISLGNFMKEYLYIPLGGNRVSPGRCLFNNWIVFLLSGIWHGASWNFAIWGAWHGLWICLSKLDRLRGKPHRDGPDGLRALPSVFVTFLLVMIGWIFFRAETLADATRFLGAAFHGMAGPGQLTLAALATPHAMAAMAVGIWFAFSPAILPRLALLNWDIDEEGSSAKTTSAICLRTILALLLIGLSTLPLLRGGFNPFIYFRF